jgi:hypothetical protein
MVLGFLSIGSDQCDAQQEVEPLKDPLQMIFGRFIDPVLGKTTRQLKVLSKNRGSQNRRATGSPLDRARMVVVAHATHSSGGSS